MKTYKLPFLLLIFLQFSCNSQVKKINGLSFVASRDTIDSKHINPALKTNSNYVALMPYSFIRNIEIPKIEFNTNREYILTYAKAATELNAEILCIGTELEDFVMNRPIYWQELIKEIKEVYKGKLTYAANWDEFKRIPFWGELDFIGIDAYFPLSEKKSPTIQDFENGWKPHKEDIIKIQKKYNKPVMFTEFGYRSIDFTGKQPWDSNRVEGSLNLQAQADALQAIHNQFWKEDWFAGGFIWKW